MEDEAWVRPRVSAARQDCQRLDSEARPLVLNTHQQLYQAGLMSELPYLFREMCQGGEQRPGHGASTGSAAGGDLDRHEEPGAPGRVRGVDGGAVLEKRRHVETVFVAEAQHVWVLRHGAMILPRSSWASADGGGGGGGGGSRGVDVNAVYRGWLGV